MVPIYIAIVLAVCLVGALVLAFFVVSEWQKAEKQIRGARREVQETQYNLDKYQRWADPNLDTKKIVLVGPQQTLAAFTAKGLSLTEAGWVVWWPVTAYGKLLKGQKYLRAALYHLARAGSICLLPGWSKSPECVVQLQLAATLNLTVIYADGAERYVPDEPAPSASAGAAHILTGLRDVNLEMYRENLAKNGGGNALDSVVVGVQRILTETITRLQKAG